MDIAIQVHIHAFKWGIILKERKKKTLIPVRLVTP